jgi:hypothetical protein
LSQASIGVTAFGAFMEVLPGKDEKGRVKMSRRVWLRDQKAAEAEVTETSEPLVG